MSAWKILVHWFLPPPLILTILLILPMPAVLKKGLLTFTRTVLFYPVFQQFRVVHLGITVTTVTFVATALSTYHLSQTTIPETLTPNQRTAVLARRWREERNFWIATLAFLLWGLIYRFYQLTLEHMTLRDRVRQLELGAVAPSSSSSRDRAPATTAAAAPPSSDKGGKGGVVPSAPPAPPDLAVNAVKEAKKTK